MKINFISKRLAANSLLAILSLMIIFHLMVLLEIIPYEIVWGGRLENKSQMIRFEVVSIVLNLVMLIVVGINAGLIHWKISRRFIKIALWGMFVLFFLNTIGNLFSLNGFEKLVFTPLTLILAVFSLRLAVKS